MSENALRVIGLTRKYRRNAGIFDVTFDVEMGEIVGIFGGELSGKTTLLRIIAGLCEADRGQASVMGYDARREHVLAASRLGTVIEEPTFYEYMTARQNMRVVARICRDVDEYRIDEVLENMGLSLCGDDKVCDFSPAMRMKLAIGLAFLTNPRVILLDEPFKALSDTDREILKNTVLEMNEEFGTSFLITSRELDDFDGLCDKVGVMENGRITAFDIPENIAEMELREGERLFEESIGLRKPLGAEEETGE